jgi:hypothetical protein
VGFNEEAVELKEKKAAGKKSGSFLYRAGNEIRTRDPQLGKLMLYQLSYPRITMYFNFPAKGR